MVPDNAAANAYHRPPIASATIYIAFSLFNASSACAKPLNETPTARSRPSPSFQKIRPAVYHPRSQADQALPRFAFDPDSQKCRRETISSIGKAGSHSSTLG
jgi:hypothetical protein